MARYAAGARFPLRNRREVDAGVVPVRLGCVAFAAAVLSGAEIELFDTVGIRVNRVAGEAVRSLRVPLRRRLSVEAGGEALRAILVARLALNVTVHRKVRRVVVVRRLGVAIHTGEPLMDAACEPAGIDCHRLPFFSGERLILVTRQAILVRRCGITGAKNKRR